jgi:hypothetical protein
MVWALLMAIEGDDGYIEEGNHKNGVKQDDLNQRKVMHKGFKLRFLRFFKIEFTNRYGKCHDMSDCDDCNDNDEGIEQLVVVTNCLLEVEVGYG